ncbi:MAG: hypothetical protein RJA52_760 [Bacteroidota bacterium]
MKYLFLTLFVLGFGVAQSQETAGKEDWIPLFNGKNLDGWIPKVRGFASGVNAYNTFRAEDGLLKVRYDGYPKFDDTFGHLFFDQWFDYYKLRVVYRTTGEQVENGPGWAFRNNGMMLHCQHPSTMGVNQDFPISIEVQLLGDDGSGKRSTANLCTPGTHVVMGGKLETNHCINSKSKTYPHEEWVTLEIIVLGDSMVQHILEGEVVMEYGGLQVGGGVVNEFLPEQKKDGDRLVGGLISIQAESHPFDFKTIELLPLKGCMDPDSPNFRPYYVVHDSGKCK